MSVGHALMKQSVCAAFLGIFAILATLGATSSARATTYTGGLGTQADPDWSVTVGPGVSLVETILYKGSAGPANQGYTTGSGHLLDWIQDGAGFTGASLVSDGQITNSKFTGTYADLFGVHFGCGKSGPCELVWLFSGDTTFTVNYLSGFSNISAFNAPSATPLPAGLPLFATGLAAFGLLAWIRKRKNAAALAA